MIAYNYRRFSGDKQNTDDESMSRQMDGAEAWAARNNVQIDRSIRLEEYATSALSGAHSDPANADKYCLAAFLERANDPNGGIVKPSYLIVENLDRLTREAETEALYLFLGILRLGISIVTTAPEEVYRSGKIDVALLMRAIIDLSRGHGESARKSELLSRFWGRRKDKTRKQAATLTKKMPQWLQVVDGKRVEIPERAEIIRRIFREVINGKGARKIADELNKEGIPPFTPLTPTISKNKPGKRKRTDPTTWAPHNVRNLIIHRAIIGEYQPHECRGKTKRKPEGAIIPDYFPRIVEDDVFYAANKAQEARRNYGNRSMGEAVNLFTSIVVDFRDQTKWSLKHAGRKKYISNVDAVTKGAVTRSLPYPVFERAMIEHIRGINPADLLPKDKASVGDRLAIAQDALKSLSDRIAEVSAEMVAGGSIASLASVLRMLEDKKSAMVSEVESLRREIATPIVEDLSQAQTLSALVETDPTVRGKLRARIAGVIKRIVVEYVSLAQGARNKPDRPSDPRSLICRVYYQGSEWWRRVTIAYTPATGGRRPESVEITHHYFEPEAPEPQSTYVDPTGETGPVERRPHLRKHV